MTMGINDKKEDMEDGIFFYGDYDHGKFPTQKYGGDDHRDVCSTSSRSRFKYYDDDNNDNANSCNNNKNNGRSSSKKWRYCLFLVGSLLAIIFVVFVVAKTNRPEEEEGNHQIQLTNYTTNNNQEENEEEENKIQHWKSSCYQPTMCTDEILDRIIANPNNNKNHNNATCRHKIHHLMSKKNHTRWDACLQISTVEFPNICGPCNPSGVISNTRDNKKTMEEENEEEKTNDNNDKEEEENLIVCYQPSSCTQEVLDTMTTETNNASCRHHIQTQMKYHNKSLGDACLHIAVDKFPLECGGCDPTGGGTSSSSSTLENNKKNNNATTKIIIIFVVAMSTFVVLFVVVLAFGTYDCINNVFCTIRQQPQQKQQQLKRSLFLYLQQFDVEDIELLKSPPGGWHGTYLNKLAYGMNKKEKEENENEYCTLDNNNNNNNEDEEAVVLLPITTTTASHSSIVSDSLFMDITTDDSSSLYVRPSLGYDVDDNVEDHQHQQQLYAEDDLEPRRSSSRINARDII